MTARFLDLSGKLQPFEDVLRESITITSKQEIPFFVVGALARDIIMKLGYGIEPKTATEDIDLGIQVANWEQFEQLKAALINTGKFKADEKYKQRFKYENQITVDIIPFGPIEEEGAIAWPPDRETVMVTLGFDEAFKDRITVRIAEDLEIPVASLAGLALMKFIAWSDRRERYRKDAVDLGLIMFNYLDAGNSERILGEEAHSDLLTDDFDYVLTGARLLGRDVGNLLTGASLDLVMGILESQTGERNQYPLIEAMLSKFYWDFEKGLGLLEGMREGILDVALRRASRLG